MRPDSNRVGGAVGPRRAENRRLHKSLRLRWRILLPTAIALSIVIALFVVGWYFHEQSEHREQAQTHARLAEREFQQLVRVESEKLQLLSLRSTVDPLLHEAWTRGSRERLFESCIPLFAEFRAATAITHFNFIDTNRTCRLRMDNPTRFGDILERQTIRQAATTGRDRCGLEMGTLGTLTLRYVRPWRVDGRLIGYIELGKEVEALATELAANIACEVVTVVHKSDTTREHFAAGRSELRLSGRWEDYEDFVVVNQSMPRIPAGLAQLVGGDATAAAYVALYKSKQNGRNRVTAFDPSLSMLSMETLSPGPTPT